MIFRLLFSYISETSLLALWLGLLPFMADVTSKGSDQTALLCSLIRVFAYHYYLVIGNYTIWLIFSSPAGMYRKSCCITPFVGDGGGGSGVDKMLKFYIKVFKVMGKVLSGELSCMRTGLFCFSVWY